MKLKNPLPPTVPVKPKKSSIEAVKLVAWLYMPVAVCVAAYGGPEIFQYLFLLSVLGAGALIFQNSGEGEQTAVAWTMVIVMAFNAAYIVSPVPGRDALPSEVAAGLWMANKLVYVFGLAYFVPAIVEPWVKPGWRQNTAIGIACLLQLWPFLALNAEREHEKHATIECVRIEDKTCFPNVDSDRPWYSSANLQEDVALGLQVVFLIAAFKVSPGAVKRGHARQAKQQSKSAQRK